MWLWRNLLMGGTFSPWKWCIIIWTKRNGGSFLAPTFLVLDATTGLIVTIKIGKFTVQRNYLHLILAEVMNNKSHFKPKLESKLGEGGQAKVFKAKFHCKFVAMKYVPLDHVKDGYEYDWSSYGCHEYFHQEKFIGFSICDHKHAWIKTQQLWATTTGCK